MKRVPITPKLGITQLVFPLKSVRTRFQIMAIIPGYRNHFFREQPQKNPSTIDASVAAFLRMLSGADMSGSTITAYRTDLAR